MALAFWICSIITLISAAVSFGFSVAGLRGAKDGATTPSMYALARSVALLVVATVAPFTGSVAFVAAITLAMVIVQGADAVIGTRIRDRVKTFGPAGTAVAGLVALVWMLSAR